MVGKHKFTEAFLTMAVSSFSTSAALRSALALGANVCTTVDKSRGWLALIYLGPGVASVDRARWTAWVCPAPRRLRITVWALSILGCLRGRWGQTGMVPTVGARRLGPAGVPGPHVDAGMPRPLKPPR